MASEKWLPAVCFVFAWTSKIGIIGRSFAMIFTSAGYQVSLYDIDQSQLTDAMADIAVQLNQLEREGNRRGVLSVHEQIKRVSTTSNLPECVTGAMYIQECVPENLDIKTKVYSALDDFLSDSSILASSTSGFVPSLLSKDMRNRKRFIVAHPTNPPYHVPLVELVPAPWTDADVVTKTTELLADIGQTPVVLRKEVDGFVLNRIQTAIIGECWRLRQEGVMSISDLDKVMTDGLGRRYAFMGQFETSYLNANGFLEWGDRYGEMLFRLQDAFGPPVRIEGQLLMDVHEEMQERVPMADIEERRKWRDFRLAALQKLKQEMDQHDS